MEFALNSKPLELYVPPVKHGVSYRTWQLVNSSGFENFILMLITLNTIILMMKWHNQSHEVKHILKFVNIIFTTLFTAETVLKIIAYGPKAFLADFWNIFDLVTVIGSIVDAIVSEFIDKEEIINTGGGVTSPYAYAFTDSVSKKAKLNIGFLRLFRATRLIKLLRQSATIRILLWTFIQSIKALPYVCLLIAMLFFLYAIVGMQIFGNIKLSSETYLNRHNNFQNFGQAVILLFRCATGESWQEIMRSCLAGAECELKESEKLALLAVPTDPKQKNSLIFTPKSNKKCGMDMAYAYFVSFVFLSSFLVSLFNFM
jgi:voltage-dependent calcium channel N type alpha-1B